MNHALLDAALIVKDEEENLAGCLESLSLLRPLLGRICVYDTGSVDRTRQIAASFGAIVEHGFWDQDFARARNAAAAMTTAKWVLSIDADERVEARQDELALLLRRGLSDGMLGWDVIDTTIIDVAEGGQPMARHPFCKLFRPSRTQWVGPLHETVQRRGARRPLRIEQAPESVIRLVHHGYAGAERRQDKARRNADVAGSHLTSTERAELTTDELAERLTDLGRSLHLAGQSAEARAAFAEAQGMKGVAPATRLTAARARLAFLQEQGEFATAHDVLDQMAAWGADTDLVSWRRAELLVAAGRAAEALPLLRSLRAVRLSATTELDGSVAVAALMRAAIDAGEYDEALACCIELVARTADVERYGDQLLRMWSDQPLRVLAGLLVDVSPDGGARLAQELGRSGGRMARLADAVHSRRAEKVRASSPTGTSPSGAAFGLATAASHRQIDSPHAGFSQRVTRSGR